MVPVRCTTLDRATTSGSWHRSQRGLLWTVERQQKGAAQKHRAGSPALQWHRSGARGANTQSTQATARAQCRFIGVQRFYLRENNSRENATAIESHLRPFVDAGVLDFGFWPGPRYLSLIHISEPTRPY